MPTTLRRPLAVALASAALSGAALTPPARAHASTPEPAPRASRVVVTNTFAFQNVGHEANGKQVMINMRNGVNARAGANRFFDFAEIGEGKTAADAAEHDELQQVFGSTGWVRFATDNPILNRSRSEWRGDGTYLVPLAGGRAVKKCSPPRHLVVGTWHWSTNRATKLAVINTHFITGGYNNGPAACKVDDIAKRLWDQSWADLRTEVGTLTGAGYDVAVTGDFNRRYHLPYLVARTVIAEHRGLDWILAAPSKGRRVIVKAHGDFNADAEPQHDTVWSTVTFANR